MKHYISILAFLLLVPSAYATNRGFFPGDAFFHSVLTQDLCTALSDSDSSVIPYIPPKSEQGGFCGFAGYWSLQLGADSGMLIKNLCALYSEQRRFTPRKLHEYTDLNGNKTQYEKNGLHIFVYNHDFAPLRHNIALRYNENWVKDEASFGPRPTNTRLESFVIDRIAFSNDWRDAAAVPKLHVECPPIPDQENRMKLGLGNRRIEAPVLVKGKVQVIVTALGDFGRYLHSRNGATFYSVTKSGIKQHAVRKGKWVVTDWSPDLE